MRQRGLSIAYQHPALVPDLTVAENIAMWLPDQLRVAGQQDRPGKQARSRPLGQVPAGPGRLHRRAWASGWAA